MTEFIITSVLGSTHLDDSWSGTIAKFGFIHFRVTLNRKGSSGIRTIFENAKKYEMKLAYFTIFQTP